MTENKKQEVKPPWKDRRKKHYSEKSEQGAKFPRKISTIDKKSVRDYNPRGSGGAERTRKERGRRSKPVRVVRIPLFCLPPLFFHRFFTEPVPRRLQEQSLTVAISPRIVHYVRMHHERIAAVCSPFLQHTESNGLTHSESVRDRNGLSTRC